MYIYNDKNQASATWREEFTNTQAIFNPQDVFSFELSTVYGDGSVDYGSLFLNNQSTFTHYMFVMPYATQNGNEITVRKVRNFVIEREKFNQWLVGANLDAQCLQQLMDAVFKEQRLGVISLPNTTLSLYVWRDENELRFELLLPVSVMEQLGQQIFA